MHLVDSLIITQPTNALIVCHLFLNHETCRSSESVLKSDLKINDILSAFVGCVIISKCLCIYARSVGSFFINIWLYSGLIL